MKVSERSTVLAVAAALFLAAPAASAQRGWDRDIEVRCESHGYAYNLCQVDTGRGGRVEIIDQISDTECVEGRSWGWNRAGVWVDDGCAGVFRVERRGGGGGRDDRGYDNGDDDYRDDRRDDRGGGQVRGYSQGDHDDRRRDDDDDDRGQRIAVRCGSQNFSYRLCEVDTGRGSEVRLTRQISGSRCVEDRTWGWNRAGIWVDEGCEAEFVIERRWR